MLDDVATVAVTDAPVTEAPATEATEAATSTSAAPVSTTVDPNATSDEEFNNLIDSIEKEQGVAPSSDETKQIDVTGDENGDQSGMFGVGTLV